MRDLVISMGCYLRGQQLWTISLHAYLPLGGHELGWFFSDVSDSYAYKNAVLHSS
jgi:hypothetical protein